MDKDNYTDFYNHIPKELLNKVVEFNDNFERIGPFKLPIELPSKEIIFFTVNHYFMFKSGHRYFVLTIDNKISLNPLLRIESACSYAHIFNSRRCDCRYQMVYSLEKIYHEENGLLIFCLDQNGKSIPGGTRGHALIYALGQLQNQDLIHDAYVKNGFKEDYRDYSDVLIILNNLEIKKARLLTNNPKRLKFLEDNGIKVTRIPLEKKIDPWVSEELIFKKIKLKHLLNCIGFKPEFLERYNLKSPED